MSCPQFGYNGSPTQLLMPGQSAGQPIHGSSATSGQPCCDSGRPVITDPLTGQSVCSCQYDAHLLNYQRLAASGLPLNMYSTAAAAAAAAAAYGGEQGFLPLGAEQSAFYSPSANGFDLKDNLEAWRSLPYAASMYYPYDSAALAGYPFTNGYGVDLNGARRKNATRETTSTLKAWLNEHRKNPYPTKGEKIMLAIITKMTLTQVSTWFANARRRLKKENKMTWSPRNRCEDDDQDGENGDEGGSARAKDADGKDGPRTDDATDNRPRHPDDDEKERRSRRDEDGQTDVVDIDDDSKASDFLGLDRKDRLAATMEAARRSLEKRPLSSPLSDASLSSDSESSQPAIMSTSSSATSATTDLQTPAKPRIWSIVDMATSAATTNSSSASLSLSSTLSTATSSGPSKMSTLQRTARLDYLTAPYPKHSSWYPGTLGGIGAVSSGVATTSFPLSSIYSCPPIVPPGSALVPGSTSSAMSGTAALSESTVSSLSRLRTAAMGFSAADLSLSKGGGHSGSSTVFGLTAPSTAADQPSGSAAAIAAIAGSSNTISSSSVPSAVQSRVLS